MDNASRDMSIVTYTLNTMKSKVLMCAKHFVKNNECMNNYQRKDCCAIRGVILKPLEASFVREVTSEVTS